MSIRAVGWNSGHVLLVGTAPSGFHSGAASATSPRCLVPRRGRRCWQLSVPPNGRTLRVRQEPAVRLRGRGRQRLDFVEVEGGGLPSVFRLWFGFRAGSLGRNRPLLTQQRAASSSSPNHLVPRRGRRCPDAFSLPSEFVMRIAEAFDGCLDVCFREFDVQGNFAIGEP